MLDNIILPAIGKLRLRAVGRRDIETLRASMKDTPYQCNRVLALLSKMFALAIEWKWTTENPVRGIEKNEEQKRECWLTVEQLQRFREALDSYADQSAANALRLLMLTGSRKSEVLKAEWEQFDLQRGLWTKPRENTKQKKVEHVPLSGPAVKLLEAMLPVNPTGPLFPGKTGGARVSLTRPWIQACKAAGLVETTTVEGKRGPLTRYHPSVRVHDLRHSFASHLVNNGVSLQIVGKLLGHAQTQTTQRYAHLQNETLRDASDVFGAIYTDAAKRKSSTK
jgi:integrase